MKRAREDDPLPDSSSLSADAVSAASGSSTSLSAFIEWIRSETKFDHLNVEIKELAHEGKGLGVIAGCNISPGSSVLRLSSSLLIDRVTAGKSKTVAAILSECGGFVSFSSLGSHDDLVEHKLDCELYSNDDLCRNDNRDSDNYHFPVYLQLFVEYLLGSSSKYYPYMALLPKRLDSPLFYNTEDDNGVNLREYLKSTRALQITMEKELQLQFWTNVLSRSDTLSTLLQQYNDAHSTPLSLSAGIRWAYAMFWSRALRVYHGTQAVDAFVPLADLLNHSERHSLEWKYSRENVLASQDLQNDDYFMLELRALEGVSAGEELCLDYGSRSSAELLSNFGFVISEAIPSDTADAFLSIPPAESVHYVIQAKCTRCFAELRRRVVTYAAELLPFSTMNIARDMAAAVANSAEIPYNSKDDMALDTHELHNIGGASVPTGSIHDFLDELPHGRLRSRLNEFSSLSLLLFGIRAHAELLRVNLERFSLEDFSSATEPLKSRARLIGAYLRNELVLATRTELHINQLLQLLEEDTISSSTKLKVPASEPYRQVVKKV